MELYTNILKNITTRDNLEIQQSAFNFIDSKVANVDHTHLGNNLQILSKEIHKEKKNTVGVLLLRAFSTLNVYVDESIDFKCFLENEDLRKAIKNGIDILYIRRDTNDECTQGIQFSPAVYMINPKMLYDITSHTLINIQKF